MLLVIFTSHQVAHICMHSQPLAMKTLKFNFNHPFKGRACLLQVDTNAPQKKIIQIDNDGLLEIPIEDCQTGKWKLILDWQYDDNSFCYQQNIDFNDI